MLTRALSGVVFVLIVIGALIYGFIPSAILFSVIALIGTYEFYKLGKNYASPYKVSGLLLTLSILVGSIYMLINGLTSQVLAIWLLFLPVFTIQTLASKSQTGLVNLSATVWGALYASLPFISILALGLIPSFAIQNFNGTLPIAVFVLTWSNDTGAYLFGRKFGKTKLFERISPNKTWEGTIGGAVFTILISYLCSILINDFAWYIWAVIAIITSVCANIGDLLESVYKRNAGVKDSGKIMPGHGGVLDRFDAIFLSAPMVLAFLILIDRI